MYKNKFITAIIFLFISGTAFSQNEDSIMIKKISDEILQNGTAYNNLRSLCKTIGQRLSGSPGMYKAEDWGVKVLTASGADKAYKQQCMVPHWVRGKKEVLNAAFNTKMKPFSILSLGNAEGTGSKAVTASIIEIQNFDELNQRKDVENKI